MAADFPNPPQSGVGEWLSGVLYESTELGEVLGRTGKVYPVYIPGVEWLPAMTFKRANTQRSYHNAGQGEAVTVMFEIRLVAGPDRSKPLLPYALLERGAKVMRDLLSGIQTEADDSKGGMHHISSVEIADELDDDDPLVMADGSDSLQRVFMVQVKHDEPARGRIIGGQ